MQGAVQLANFFPRIDGWLEAIFIGLLVLLAGAVGLFALFVLVQQFRNPGRR
ncbi:MAG: hypothetical protein OEW46_03630 [Actinomycetota bacterium]|nr:hypothetical protein [Actinomycetota bacterium]